MFFIFYLICVFYIVLYGKSGLKFFVENFINLLCYSLIIELENFLVKKGS